MTWQEFKDGLKVVGVLFLLVIGLGVAALLGLVWLFSQPHPFGG